MPAEITPTERFVLVLVITLALSALLIASYILLKPDEDD